MPVVTDSGSVAAAPGSFGELIDRIFRWAPQQARIDRLDSALSGASSQLARETFTVEDPTRWGAPTDIEIGAEVLHVMTVDPGTATITALRGYYDTFVEAHAADDIVRIAPRFFRKDAQDAVIDCLRHIVPPLWRIKTTDLTWSSGTSGYNLPSDTLDVYRLWSRVNSSTKEYREKFRYDVLHDMPTTDFASGKALMLLDRGYPDTLRVQYKAKFTEPDSELDDMTTDVGLSDFMLDVPAWYAVSQLVPPDEVMRSQSNRAVPSRQAEQVVPRQNITAAEYFYGRYERALKAAAKRLEQLYPTRIRYVH